MESLEDLGSDLKELNEDASAFPNDLLLYASLLLKDYDAIFPPYDSSVPYSREYTDKTSFHNWRAQKFIEFFTPVRHFDVYRKFYTGDSIPDVCGGCFQSFGLSTGGRYRFDCYLCRGAHLTNAWERLLAMHRYCVDGELNRAILSQLIYKYYSPNGDTSWEIKSYNPLI